MFLFTPCQVGAEAAFKSEVRRLFPQLRLSFGRPGFLTFKIPDEADAGETVFNVAQHSVFARTVSLSLGKIARTEFDDIAAEAWDIVGQHRLFINRVHVFRRDPFPTGEKDFEPGMTPENQALHRILTEHSPKPKFLGQHSGEAVHPATPGETVLDVVAMDAAEGDLGQYFVGVHSVVEDSPIFSRYPGGVMPLSLPEDAVSRAWLKFEEGLRWSGFPIGKGSCCVDIGAAPGGASQTLLARGAKVLGVDPAAIDPVVWKNPHFTHVRGKLNQKKRSVFQDVNWVIADMNVAPNYTLDVLEEFVGWKGNTIRGMLFTLKLFQWELAEDFPAYTNRLRKLGFGDIQIKQLAFNRQEVMVAAKR